MTSSLPPKSRRSGFTLVELLVVIGIIVLLATILLPMANHAYTQAKRAQMAADLAVISGALEAYRSDFGDYPRLRGNTSMNGAALLCWALVAPGPAVANGAIPGDGADGPGFRIRGTSGAIKGPYLPLDRFVIGTTASTSMISDPSFVTPALAGAFDDRADVLGDRYSHPILYFAANKSVDPTSAGVAGGAFVNQGSNPQAVFNYGDATGSQSNPNACGIAALPNQLTYKVMCFRLGNTSGTGTIQPSPPNSETPITTGPYLLWASGPDGKFGTTDDIADNGTSIQLNTDKLPAVIFPPFVLP